MHISEIPPNTELNIVIKIKDTELSLPSSVIELSEQLINVHEALENKLKFKVLMIPALKSDDKYINFDSNDMHIHVSMVHENLEYEFKHVKITSLTILGKRYNLLLSNENISFTNRRENFRVDVGVPCTIMIKGHSKAVNGTVKDLSNNGIGLIVRNDLACVQNDYVRVSFDDIRRKAQFHAECTIVRISEIDGRKKLIGCSIDNIKPNPNYYINRIQRETLSHSKI